MSNKISKIDVDDTEFVDAEELVSDGLTNPYKSVSIVTTTSGTNEVVISAPTDQDRLDFPDEPVQVGDIFEVIAGPAIGRYLVQSIVDPVDTFITVEPIPNSAGNSGIFFHPAGATKVGVDPTNIQNSTSTVLQDVLEDLDSAISADGYVNVPAQCIGQVLYSVNGINFKAAMPITTNQGWLVNAQGTLIVGDCDDGNCTD